MVKSFNFLEAMPLSQNTGTSTTIYMQNDIIWVDLLFKQTALSRFFKVRWIRAATIIWL